MELAETYFDMSTGACSYLVWSLVEDGEFSKSTHIENVRWTSKSARVTQDLLDAGAMERWTHAWPAAKHHIKKILEDNGMF